MSCYVCEKETFVAILKGMVKYRIIMSDNDTLTMYQWLVDLNYESVNARYKENTLPPKVELTRKEIEELYTTPITDNEIFEAVREYQYQSCECENYYKYPAYYQCNWLKDDILRKYLAEN